MSAAEADKRPPRPQGDLIGIGPVTPIVVNWHVQRPADDVMVTSPARPSQHITRDSRSGQ